MLDKLSIDGYEGWQKWQTASLLASCPRTAVKGGVLPIVIPFVIPFVLNKVSNEGCVRWRKSRSAGPLHWEII